MIATDIGQAQFAGLAALDAAERELDARHATVVARHSGDRWADAMALRDDFAHNHHRTTKGDPLDLTPRWLMKIYAETALNMVVKKSVQCGVSEWLVCLELALAAVGFTTFHVLPTYDVRNRFVQQRVNREILMVPRYQELSLTSIGEVDNLRVKNFGDGVLYFAGSNTPNEFIEIPADVKLVDEIDRCDQRNLAMADDRISGPGMKASVIIGNPTHADYGISAAYEASDQRQWHIKCRSCGDWQPLDFFVNVVHVDRDAEGNARDYTLLDQKWNEDNDEDIKCYCRKCHAPLDRHENDPKHCRWIATYPKRKVVGYHISKLFTRQTTLAALWLRFRKALDDAWEFQIFMNSDLGIEYSPPGSALTDDLLNACCRDYMMPGSIGDRSCSMGVDVGATMDVRISDRPESGVRRAAFIGRVKSFDDLTALSKRYHVRRCVIDAEPEVRKTIEWADSFGTGRKRRVWRADLFSQQTARDLPNAKQDDSDDGLLRLDRTQLLDMATADIMRQRNWLPRNAASLMRGDFYKQMKEPKRVMVTAPDGTQRWTWTKGVDHQRFADAFDCYASSGLGITMASAESWAEVTGVSVDSPYEGY